MKTLIVCTSVSHGNTKRIADAMAPTLDAHVVSPQDIAPTEPARYDLVGFGSGIFTRSFHPALRGFIEGLPQEPDEVPRHSFAFATSGFAEAGPQRFFPPLVKALRLKGFETIDTFSCRGWDTFLPFKPFGGIRKGRPDAGDLELARAFAQRLRSRIDV
ncbi:flavodoxin family protein [Streptomyces sp. NPDC058221]|uniref:flavodoxin family protein n=1 Tax=Streptomyces sp. NPDC058221 TaxID=3346388 RepID=UPI0036EEC960